MKTQEKTAAKTAADWIAEIERAAAGSDAETRTIHRIEIGQHVRQGDLYVIRIKDCPTKGEISDRQLAPGSTQGSRHVAEGDVTIYRVESRDVAIGPIVFASAQWRLAHPEHAHMVLPAGTYQIRYQVDEHAQQVVRD